jgi:hypothetical protein
LLLRQSGVIEDACDDQKCNGQKTLHGTFPRCPERGLITLSLASRISRPAPGQPVRDEVGRYEQADCP